MHMRMQETKTRNIIHKLELSKAHIPHAARINFVAVMVIRQLGTSQVLRSCMVIIRPGDPLYRY